MSRGPAEKQVLLRLWSSGDSFSGFRLKVEGFEGVRLLRYPNPKLKTECRRVCDPKNSKSQGPSDGSEALGASG